MTDHDLLTVDDVMVYLRVTRRTVYRWIAAREIPAIQAGRQWRFPRQAFEAWLKRRPDVSSESSQPRRTRVLIVDDDPDMQAFLVSALVDGPYDVETAADGTAALTRLEQGSWDLLITDLNMVQMDGLSLVRRLRRRSKSLLLPIVIVTGFSTEDHAITALNLGVSGYLTKPFEKAHVCAAVTRALNRARLNRLAQEPAEAG
jgi:excisionase family DNA binding protein